ncbi:MAG: metal ABC transporter permease [Gammaproteobacteria bacterium]
MEPFIIRAALAGIGVAVVAGVLGCFVVWRRMAYFGDALAHGALLGVALALLADFPAQLGIFAAGAVFSFLLVWLRRQKRLATDVLLGILAHAALAAGIVAASLSGAQFDLHAYLFGDILFVSDADLLWLGGGGALALALLAARWTQLTLLAVDEDIAAAEGVNPFRANLLLTLLVALSVALSVRIIGVLLITALLIIPAATARPFAGSPAGMALLSAALGVLAVIAGLAGSLHFDAPAGASIVSASALLFALLLPFSGRRKNAGR